MEDFQAPTLRKVTGPDPSFLTYLWRSSTINGVASATAVNDRRARAVAHIIGAADRAMSGPLYLVADKRLTPPGGDKQDYCTGGAYWWPTPGAPDGMPWMFRDGYMYPGRFGDDYDLTRLDAFAEAVKMLALAHRFAGEAAYAARAAELIRTWFLDPDRKMRPHLTYAQRTPGRERVTGAGIIETLRFVHVINAIGLLAPSSTPTPDEIDGVRNWFSRYARSIRTSENDRLEPAAIVSTDCPTTYS